MSHMMLFLRAHLCQHGCVLVTSWDCRWYRNPVYYPLIVVSVGVGRAVSTREGSHQRISSAVGS